ncbi:MAG TPA: hypothetical protein DD611_02505 [Alphaproteobacteria bacterium]|nr:hypothetical protein [Alphaproteobacteria bacterium]
MNAIAELLTVPGTVVSLDGDWGSGKTYSWDNKDKPESTIRGQLEKNGKKTIYVSLFGKKSVSQLKKEILNLSINAKGCLFHFTLITVLIFFLSIIMAIFAFQISSNHRTSVLIISIVLSGIIVGKFYEHILKFFAQKTLGFDHNNIDFSTILNNDNVVFCFDDLERLSENSNLEEFMGFFELLSRQKFSMLLIYNSNRQIEEHAKKWKEFKEKVVKASLLQKTDGIIDIMLRDKYLTTFEQQFMRSIYDSLQRAQVQLEAYVEQERNYVNSLASNFRFYKKLIDFFKQIKSITKSYKNLNENDIGNMLMYVTVIVVHKELELPLKNAPTKDFLYKFLFGREPVPNSQTGLKHFGRIFVSDQWYGLVEFPTIYEFLNYGHFDYKAFEQEHTSVSNSELEIYTLSLEHWLQYRKPQQIEIVKNIEKLLQKGSAFTSLENMRQVLTKYSVFCSYIEKDLATYDADVLSQNIKDFINNNEVPLDEYSVHEQSGSLVYITNEETEEFVKNKRFINSIFEKSLLEYWINRIKSTTNIENTIQGVLKGNLSYYNQLYLYVLFNDVDRQQQIFRLRDTNYSKWQDITSLFKRRINEYDESSGFIKSIKDMLNDTRICKKAFIDALTANVKELETLPGAGLSEQYTVKNFISNK